MSLFLTLYGKKELIQEFKENFEINIKQTGKKDLAIVNEFNLEKLKREWTKRIQNTSGIIYKYIQKDLIDSFIKDIKKNLE